MPLHQDPFSPLEKGAVELAVMALVIPTYGACGIDAPRLHHDRLIAASGGTEGTIFFEPFPAPSCSIPASTCPALRGNIGNRTAHLVDSTARKGKVAGGVPVIDLF